MSVFPTKILLATDGSKDAELATTTALDLANSTGSECTSFSSKKILTPTSIRAATSSSPMRSWSTS